MALPKPITTEADVHAWRALLEFRADSDAQRRCVDWLAQATGRAGVPYVPGADGERDTLVLIGQQRIGVLIGNMMLPATLAQARQDDIDRANPRPTENPNRRPTRRNRKDET
jgi:hypothetical protein